MHNWMPVVYKYLEYQVGLWYTNIGSIKFISKVVKARNILLIDLPDFFSDLGSGGQKTNKKALKMTSWLVIFEPFVFSELFFL